MFDSALLLIGGFKIYLAPMVDISEKVTAGSSAVEVIEKKFIDETSYYY